MTHHWEWKYIPQTWRGGFQFLYSAENSSPEYFNTHKSYTVIFYWEMSTSWMAGRHMQRYSTSISHQENEKVKPHWDATIHLKWKRPITCWPECGTMAILVVELEMDTTTLKTPRQYQWKLRVRTAYDSAILAPTPSHQHVHQRTCARMFLAALFIIAQAENYSNAH